jgi:CubicO group peptidase (beta-lactamase class C family)
VTPAADMVGWPAGSAFQFVRVDGSDLDVVAHGGDIDGVRHWASVTKLAAALAVARCVDRGAVSLDEPAGPPGATLAHLLAHASGLGLEEADRQGPPGARRVYSNVGIDLACSVAGAPTAAGEWIENLVFEPLGVNATVRGRPSSGAAGSVCDLVALGRAWLNGDLISDATRHAFLTPFMPALSGVVPGFGRFDPCWWGLGPELHGTKAHWMGTVFSPASFGHFGSSGAMLLVDPVRATILAAAAGAPFGGWAVDLWPAWTDSLATSVVD